MYYFAVLSGAGIALTFVWSCGKNRRNSLKKRIPKSLSRSKKTKGSARAPSQEQNDRKNVPGGFGSVKSSNRVKETKRKERKEKDEKKKSSKGKRNKSDLSSSRRSSSNSSSRSNKSQSSKKSGRKLRNLNRSSKSNYDEISGKDVSDKSVSSSQKSQDKTEKDFSGRSWRKSLQDNEDLSKKKIAPPRQHETDIDEDDRSMKPPKKQLKKRSKLSKKPEKPETPRKNEKKIKNAVPTVSGTVMVEPDEVEQQKEPHVDEVISKRFEISADNLIAPTPTNSEHKAPDNSASAPKPAPPPKTTANAPNPLKKLPGRDTASGSKKKPNQSVGTKKLKYRQIPSKGRRTAVPKKSKFNWFGAKTAKGKS